MIWYYQARKIYAIVWIHEASEIVSGTKNTDSNAVYFRCIMNWCLSAPGPPKYILAIAHSTFVTAISLCSHCYSFVMYLEAVIKLDWRCTRRPRSTDFTDALGAHDQASWEMHLEALIKGVWRCTSRLWSRQIGGVHRGGRSGGGQWAVVDARCTGWWDSILQLVNSESWECDKVTVPLKFYGELAGGSQSVGRPTKTWIYIQGSTCNHVNEETINNFRCMLHQGYAIVGVCCTLCMLYSVDAVPGVCCTRCILSSGYAVLRVCCIRYIPYLLYSVLGACYMQWILNQVYCCTRCILHWVYTALSACCIQYSLQLVNTALGVCCTWCILHFVCFACGVMLYSASIHDYGMARLRGTT
jgi:hypothetical protein